jgi:hypothetical protein
MKCLSELRNSMFAKTRALWAVFNESRTANKQRKV